MARRFSSWNVRVTNTSSSVSGTDLVQQLVTRVSDETIARFFQSPSVWDKLDFKQCALALGALAGSSTRGSALTYTNELRNKQKWSKLVELLAERTLTLKHPRHKSIMESNNHFISTCNSLAKLRYAQAPERLVRKLPHDPAYCFPHLLRYVAEVNGSVDLVLQDAEQFAERLASVKQLSWLPAHLASSLSMLLCDNPARLNQLPALEKIHHWVWKQQPSTTSTSDLLDLFENYLVFKPQVSSDLFTKLQSTYETHPRQREVHSSRFQSQVAQALQVLDLAYQHEAMDGVSICNG
ncbi:hypothetical protein BASA81_002051 [Batrachochytrium salamandrivorans]|nr:hypothetical protein BASA81_002051 [Batrachochytrium salamandrivorans]